MAPAWAAEELHRRVEGTPPIPGVQEAGNKDKPDSSVLKLGWGSILPAWAEQGPLGSPGSSHLVSWPDAG